MPVICLLGQVILPKPASVTPLYHVHLIEGFVQKCITVGYVWQGSSPCSSTNFLLWVYWLDLRNATHSDGSSPHQHQATRPWRNPTSHALAVSFIYVFFPPRLAHRLISSEKYSLPLRLQTLCVARLVNCGIFIHYLFVEVKSSSRRRGGQQKHTTITVDTNTDQTNGWTRPNMKGKPRASSSFRTSAEPVEVAVGQRGIFELVAREFLFPL